MERANYAQNKVFDSLHPLQLLPQILAKLNGICLNMYVKVYGMEVYGLSLL